MIIWLSKLGVLLQNCFLYSSDLPLKETQHPILISDSMSSRLTMEFIVGAHLQRNLFTVLTHECSTRVAHFCSYIISTQCSS